MLHLRLILAYILKAKVWAYVMPNLGVNNSTQFKQMETLGTGGSYGNA